ncbi:MAG: cupin, partial [Cyanobacteriota bacterium]|nr:cupin [Cyanobacteriota bacterium]
MALIKMLLDGQTCLAGDRGTCNPLDSQPWNSTPQSPYRLYRFLSELDDILERVSDDVRRLQLIIPLVRRLLDESPWLQFNYDTPDSNSGWSVQMLYDEPEYPLTVQMVAWAPGQVSPIHNHATWGIVALLEGEEKNTLWRRTGDPQERDRLEWASDRILKPGDIMAFLPDTIHCVEALGQTPTVSFNLYGETDYDSRFTFDPNTHQ